MAIYKLKNISGIPGNWGGQDIDADELYILDGSEVETFRTDGDVFAAVASGELEVHGEDDSFPNPVDGWAYFLGDVMPKSDLDGKKLAVHTSYKPSIPGVSTYAVWTGAGDDMTPDATDVVGNGPLLHFDMTAGNPTTEILVKFHPSAGRVWIHEGYLKFTGAGAGDYIEADIVAPASVLQPVANLNLLVDSETGEVKPSLAGAGTGTHGFAATPALVPRHFSKNGHWDYSPAAGLTANPYGKGNFAIYDNVQSTHRYINKIPCFGDCNTYFSMSSDETSELPQPYYLRLTVHNKSNTNWHASVLLEIYREKTV